MNNNYLLATLTVGIFAMAALIFLPSSALTAPTYTAIAQAGVQPIFAPPTFVGQISTNGTIPQIPDSYINSTLGFGYAWQGSGNPTNTVLAIIHTSGIDSSLSPNLWHAETAKLSSTLACSGIGYGLQITGLTIPTESGITISNNAMSLWVNNGNVTSSTFSSAKSFQVLQPVGGTLCIGPP